MTKPIQPQPVQETPAPGPFDPALQMLLTEMEALARILPPVDGPELDGSEEAEEAFFDNMPV